MHTAVTAVTVQSKVILLNVVKMTFDDQKQNILFDQPTTKKMCTYTCIILFLYCKIKQN